MKTQLTCIYCLGKVDEEHIGDHVIPATLGVFQKDNQFKHICIACNNYIGTNIESVFLECSYIRYFRDLVLGGMDRDRRKFSGWKKKVKGINGPTINVKDDFADLNGEMIGPLTIAPYDQIIIEKDNEESLKIRLDPNMSEETIRGILEPLNLKKGDRIKFDCDQESTEIYVQKFKNINHNIEYEHVSTREAGIHLRKAMIEMQISPEYYRTIVKIAFHFFLTNTDTIRGSDQSFERTRNFIINGGEFPGIMLRIDRKDIIDFSEINTQDTFKHTLGHFTNKNDIFVYVSLFHNSQKYLDEYLINIGAFESAKSKIITPYAQEYIYHPVIPTAGKAGIIRELEPDYFKKLISFK
jgi:hypothetical protein